MCPLPSKRVLKTGGVLLLVMLIIGSFFDCPISQMLYNESSPFGMFFAAFGEYPAALGFVAAGHVQLLFPESLWVRITSQILL